MLTRSILSGSCELSIMTEIEHLIKSGDWIVILGCIGRCMYSTYIIFQILNLTGTSPYSSVVERVTRIAGARGIPADL